MSCADDIAFSFKQLGVSSLFPPEPILCNVSGFVKKGGITAILGASASGKSLLMKALAGRLPLLHVTGHTTLDGKEVDLRNLTNEVAYVPQDDFLIGDLTPFETLSNALTMKRGEPAAVVSERVDALLTKFGLGNVANNVIGTVFKRGLSGGQRKRVEICSELIAPPKILLCDEPTSGLDGAIAFDVLSTMKEILAESNGNLSLLISIHQPNNRILGLIDHILLLGGGGQFFFGTVHEAQQYFTEIGFPAPPAYTPTDVFLQVSDPHFGENQDFDFEGSFVCHRLSVKLEQLLDEVARVGMYSSLLVETESAPSSLPPQASSTASTFTQRGIVPMDFPSIAHEGGTPSQHSSSDDPMHSSPPSSAPHMPAPSELANHAGAGYLPLSHSPHPAILPPSPSSWSLFGLQYWTLLMRDLTLAYRDPSLYYLQFFLVDFFGILVGCAFFQLDATIDGRILDIPSSLLWITMMMCYVQVFKVYHLSKADARFQHEVANQTFSPFASFWAEWTTNMLLLTTFIPGTAIAYFMIGLPGSAYPFCIIALWVTTLAAESMLNVITKFSHITTVSVVASQGVLVILTVFGGGMFIPWKDCPHYWKWLQELSIFTQSSRAITMAVMKDLDYTCVLDSLDQCYDTSGQLYPCDASPPANGQCTVHGRTVMYILQGTSTEESYWVPLGYLALILGVLRIGVILLMLIPWDRILYTLQDLYSGISSKGILESKLGLRRMQGQLTAYIALQRSQGNLDLPAEVLEDDPADEMEARQEQKSSPTRDHPSPGGRQRSRSLMRMACSMLHEFYANPLTQSALLDSSDWTTAAQDEPGIQERERGNSSPAIRSPSLGLKPQASSHSTPKACLEWKDVSVVLRKKGAVLIDRVSGVALPGRILALMGPSGAGKTTLLNALSNRAPYARLEGSVTFGKRPFVPSDLIYVPQFDEFNASLTVMEQILLVGELKCVDQRSMRQRLAKLLLILGLAHKMHVQCRELTGGELKRVSVGMGMISNPNVLFLDEPTTSLDSSAAFSIVNYLSELAIVTNVVVIMTIHQPSAMVFDKLHDFYLLENGRLAYFGPLATARGYFARFGYDCPLEINPADFYLDLVNKPPSLSAPPANAAQLSMTPTHSDSPFSSSPASTTWADLYRTSRFASNFLQLLHTITEKALEAEDPPSPPSFAQRLHILCVFFLKYYYRERGFYWLRLSFLILVALFIGTLFIQLTPTTENISKYSGAIFFAIWTCLFSAVSATGLFASDRRLAIEQVKNAVLTPSVYCLAQFLASVPFNIIASVVFQCIFHWMTDLNPRGESFVYGICVSAGHLLLMEAFMLTVVAALKNAMLSVTFAMCIMGYFFLFSGFFIAVENMPIWIRWIAYLAPTQYSFAGYLYQVYATQTFSQSGGGGEVEGKEILDEVYYIGEISSWGMFGALLAALAIVRFMHYGLFLFDVHLFLRKA